VASRSHDDGQDRWTIVEARPGPSLTGCVDRYVWWSEHTRSFTTRRELASTTGVLIVNLGSPLEIADASGVTHRIAAGQGFAGGLAQSTSLSRSTGEMEGIHVHMAPAGLARSLGVPLAALTDRCFTLADLLGADADRLGERLLDVRPGEARWRVLDGFLAGRLGGARAEDRELDHARALLARGWRVEVVARELSWSRKRLAQRFRDAVGMHPRAFAGLARFERFTAALQAHPSKPLAQAALDAGYADQAHLTREVARYAELTPAQLRARLIPAGGGVRE
jgi:AraC-like DNA-binding protein